MLSTEDPNRNRIFASDIMETELLLEGANTTKDKKRLLIKFLKINYEWADPDIDPKEIGDWDFGELWSLWIEIRSIPYMVMVLYNGNIKGLSYIV